jgi:predicted transcriptional regulator
MSDESENRMLFAHDVVRTKTFELLEALYRADGAALNVSALARAARTNTTWAHDYCSALVELGVVERLQVGPATIYRLYHAWFPVVEKLLRLVAGLFSLPPPPPPPQEGAE